MLKFLKKYDPRFFNAKRQILGIHQIELGNLCGFSQGMISKMERGACTDRVEISIVGSTLENLARGKGEKCLTIFKAIDEYAESL